MILSSTTIVSPIATCVYIIDREHPSTGGQQIMVIPAQQLVLVYGLQAKDFKELCKKKTKQKKGNATEVYVAPKAENTI